MDLEAAARAANAEAETPRVVLLGHGSLDNARTFQRHFPVETLMLSEDMKAFAALRLRRGSLWDFLGPAALLTAVPSAFQSLTRRGTLQAKLEQPLPGRGDLRQMGGLFLFGPGDRCDWARVERTPGDYPTVEEIRKRLEGMQ